MNKNEGFTFIEAAAALAITTILGLVSIGLFSESVKFLNKAAADTIRNKDTASLFYFTLTTVQRIRLPYWIDLQGKIIHFTDGKAIIIPYLDGRQECAVSLVFKNGVLTIKTPGVIKHFSGWDSCIIDILKTAEDSIEGLSLALKQDSREYVRIIAPFGAIGKAVFREADP